MREDQWDAHEIDEATERYAPCIWPDWWPAHAGNPACGEGYCRRCEMEQEHGESHEGEPCPWMEADEPDWNVATSEHLSVRPGEQ